MRQKYLQGEKIFLSPVEPTDVEILKQIKNQKFVRDFMSSSLPMTSEDVLKDIEATKQSGSPYFLICEQKGEKVVGFVKLEIVSSIIRASEIHIGIMQEFTNHGYGKEVVHLITEYAFCVLNIHSVRALIRAKNSASMATFESQGYKKVGTLPEWSFYDGEYHDCHIYDCIPSFWK